MTLALFLIVLALGVFLLTYKPTEVVGVRVFALVLLLTACGTLLLRADPAPIAWSGGTEYTVANAPAGYESLHFGTSFSFTQAAVPDGQYVVTFSFIEPTVQAVGQRVFDVSINDQPVIRQLDVFARAGFMTPVTRSVVVDVKGGRMVFNFTASVRSAVVSGIVIEPLTNVVLTTK
jgi:hypothetical protein